jgi:hypothetical protein
MNDTFGFTIMRGCVCARHPELCAIRQEEDPGGKVVKFMSVVALDDFDLPVELIRHISKDEQFSRVNSLARDEQYHALGVTVAWVLCRWLGLAEVKKNSDSDYHVSGEGLPRN